MVTKRQYNELTQLNVVFNNNETFKNATNICGLRVGQLSQCICIVDLYNYLYKHYDIISDVFKTNNSGEIDVYLAHRVIGFLHGLMLTNQFTVPQALKELKRVRNSVDYNGSLG